MKNLSETVGVAARAFTQFEELRSEILRRYENVKFNETGRTLTSSELKEFLQGCSKAIISLEKVDADVLEQLPMLHTVSKYGVGLDNIDFNSLEKHRVRIGWKGGVNRRSVAELALSMMLVLARQSMVANQRLRSGQWTRPPGRLLSERTVGIVGCGHIGKDLALLLKPFGCEVLAFDKIHYGQFYEEHGLRAVSFAEILERSDIISVHTPLTAETYNMFNAETISRMKRGSILINTARGGIIQEADLLEALKTEHLGGAGLDVFVEEPCLRSELLKLENVFATTHIGGSSTEAIIAMGLAAIEGLENSVNASEFVSTLS